MNSPYDLVRALAADHALTPTATSQLEAFLGVLSEDDTAPTTVRDPIRAVQVHLADALDALAVPAVREATTIADIGAGAGIPGIPLAIALPAATVRLVESVGKKCDFIDRAAATAGVRNARAVHARAEEWPEGVGANDVVTARALAPLGVLIEYAAPLLRDGGVLVAWKANLDATEAGDASAAADALGMEPAHRLEQPRRPGADERSLYVYLKVRPTPERFPRRPGMARKRPITGQSA